MGHREEEGGNIWLRERERVSEPRARSDKPPPRLTELPFSVEWQQSL